MVLALLGVVKDSEGFKGVRFRIESLGLWVLDLPCHNMDPHKAPYKRILIPVKSL